jgi:hypothetical protein
MNSILSVLSNRNLRPALIKYQDATRHSPEPVVDPLHLAVALEDDKRYTEIVSTLQKRIVHWSDTRHALTQPAFELRRLKQLKVYRRSLASLEQSKNGDRPEVTAFLENYRAMKKWQHRKRSNKIRFNGKSLIEVRAELAVIDDQIKYHRYYYLNSTYI